MRLVNGQAASATRKKLQAVLSNIDFSTLKKGQRKALLETHDLQRYQFANFGVDRSFRLPCRPQLWMLSREGPREKH